MKLGYIVIIAILMFSCSDFEQSYNTSAELNQANLRLKGWFPEFAKADCSDLKESHSLENSESFGKFSYNNSTRMDSLLSEQNGYTITYADSLIKFLQHFKFRQPSWFSDYQNVALKSYYYKGAMYFIRDNSKRTIYFAYTTR